MDTPFAIVRAGKVLLRTNRRDAAFRLAGTRSFAGAVCQEVFGQLVPIEDCQCTDVSLVNGLASPRTIHRTHCAWWLIDVNA